MLSREAACTCTRHVNVRTQPTASRFYGREPLSCLAARDGHDLMAVLYRVTGRLHVLPLVSKRWARIMKTSAEVWKHACIDLEEILRDGPDGERCSLNLPAMAVWFHARLGRIQQLGLMGGESKQLPTVVTSMLLSSQAASLRNLSVDLAAYGLHGPGFGIIAAITGLVALGLHVDGCGLADRGAAVMRTVPWLTALKHLQLVYADIPGEAVADENIKLPRCQELAELRSHSLQRMSLAIASGTGDVLRLAGVRNLQECRLLADNPGSAEFQVDPSSFKGCEKLAELTLQGLQGLALQTGCFSMLSAITSLALQDCGLQTVPSEVAQLTSLRCFDLSQNDRMQCDAAGLSVLRQLQNLRALDVAKTEPGYYTAASTQALFDLVEAFQKHGKPLHINFDPESSETYIAEFLTYWGFIEDS